MTSTDWVTGLAANVDVDLRDFDKAHSLVRESGWIKGSQENRENWKRIVHIRRKGDVKSDGTIYTDDGFSCINRVSDSDTCFRTYENEQELNGRYLASALLAAVSGRLAYNLGEGIHTTQFMLQPRKYVQAIVNATASGQAVEESGWHVIPVKFCDVDRKGLVEYVRNDQLGGDFADRAYRLALELNDLPSSDRAPIFKLVIRHARHVAAISREYHSGEVDIYDRQFVLNYLPCGTVIRPTGSACKACYCTTKRMEKMWQDSDMGRQANRQLFIDIEGRTHVFSRRAFIGNCITVFLALSAITYYFRGEVGTPKDDLEVLVTAFAAGSAFYVIYNHLFGSGESVRDAVRSRRPVGGISEHVPAAQRVAFLRWATYFSDIGRILSLQDSCSLTTTARGAYSLDIDADSDFMESMGMLFCKDAIIFPDSEGLVVNQVSRLSGLRYHTDWHESNGLLVTEVVAREAILGQRQLKLERD